MQQPELTPSARIEIIRQVYSLLALLQNNGGLAGVIFTDDSYFQLRKELGLHVAPFSPAEITVDPAMEHSFVVNGLLFLRGTPA